MMNYYKKIYAYLCLLRCIWVIVWRSAVILIYTKLKRISRIFINQFARAGASKILNICQIKYKTVFMSSFEWDKQSTYIFMSNHQSLFDLPLIFAALPGTIRFVAKRELFRIPLFGAALTAGECVPIDRDIASNNQNFFAFAQKKLAEGVGLWIFPEGSRSKSGELLSFKSGGFRLARETGAKIIPVGIVGTRNVLPANKLTLGLKNNVEIRIAPPVDTTQYPALADQKKLMLKIEATIRELIQ